jgi:hypothetical protein
MQCENPSCVAVCPTRATYKTEDGHGAGRLEQVHRLQVLHGRLPLRGALLHGRAAGGGARCAARPFPATAGGAGTRPSRCPTSTRIARRASASSRRASCRNAPSATTRSARRPKAWPTSTRTIPRPGIHARLRARLRAEGALLRRPRQPREPRQPADRRAGGVRLKEETGNKPKVYYLSAAAPRWSRATARAGRQGRKAHDHDHRARRLSASTRSCRAGRGRSRCARNRPAGPGHGRQRPADGRHRGGHRLPRDRRLRALAALGLRPRRVQHDERRRGLGSADHRLRLLPADLDRPCLYREPVARLWHPRLPAGCRALPLARLRGPDRRRLCSSSSSATRSGR